MESGKKKLIPTISNPPPINGKLFTKIEIVKIISPYKDRYPIKIKLMSEILRKKLVPEGGSQSFYILKNPEDKNLLLTMNGKHVVNHS